MRPDIEGGCNFENTVLFERTNEALFEWLLFDGEAFNGLLFAALLVGVNVGRRGRDGVEVMH
jgi:hypothetical protein